MKVCTKCGGPPKALSEFYKNHRSIDGYFHKCKECVRETVLEYRKKNLESIRAYDREKAKRPHRKKQHLAYVTQYYEKFPERRQAHNKVTKTIKAGKLVRPTVCPSCKTKDRRIEAHILDYSNPLEVEWLCAACHRQLDLGLTNGEKNHGPE